MNLNVYVNQANRLQDIPVMKASLNFQDIKQDIQFSTFRNELLSNGIGSWFYEGYFWALPLNDSLNLPIIKPMASSLFSKDVEWKQETIKEFDSKIWFHLGISLVRDSIIYSLRKKFKTNLNIRIHSHYPEFTIFDKSQIAFSDMSVSVWTGLAIDKIVPVDNHNIAVCPYLDYGVFENTGKPVFDKKTRQNSLYRTKKCSIDIFKKRFQSMLSLVFPFETILSNKRLLFDQPIQILV